MNEIVIEMPIKTVSEANIKSHWSVRATRARIQRRSAYYLTREAMGNAYHDLCKESMEEIGKTESKIKIEMIRYGVKKMDDDNLRIALKAVRDGICDWLKIDDGSDRLKWEYSQIVGIKKRHLTVKISGM